MSLPLEKADRRSITNTWYLPLEGTEGWEERVTVWVEPVEDDPSNVRVQHSIVLPRDGAVENGWAVGTKSLLDAWSKRLSTDLATKPTKIGSRLEFPRDGRPSIHVSRARLGSTKVWHVVLTEVSLRPKR